MNVTVISPGHPSWNSEIERLGILLGTPDNRSLFPYHFLAVVLPRIGGHLAFFDENEILVGAGFVFPRFHSHHVAYTIRYHPIAPAGEVVPGQLTALLSSALGSAPVTYYDPTAPQQFEPSDVPYGDVTIGRPSAVEAEQVRAIQERVWGSPPEFLYPTDIHSTTYQMATSLVARVEGKLAGFLFGMDKVDGPSLPADWHARHNGQRRIESQTMGVLPEYRGLRIGFLLKRVQAESALANDIGIINWTVDPLQFSNATLNFGLLRAIAFDFYADLYPFRNELNRVHASRFAINWLVGTQRVRDVPLFGARSRILDLSHYRHIARVNRGWTDVNYTVTNNVIAIEIPADWTAVQRQDLENAVAWRAATDRIFKEYLGRQTGKYAITGAGVDGNRRYLIGERVDDNLWEQLGH